MDLERRLDELKALKLTTNDPARIVRHKECESVTFLRGANDTNGERHERRIAAMTPTST